MVRLQQWGLVLPNEAIEAGYHIDETIWIFTVLHSYIFAGDDFGLVIACVILERFGDFVAVD